jgi:hypothetical protein
MISILFLSGVATKADAFLLNPGFTVDITNTAVPAGSLLASQDIPFTTSLFSGMSHQEVYSNSTGVLFVYSFDNDEGSDTSITRMTAANFAGWTTWTDASLTADPTYSVDRSFPYGSTIGFGFKNGIPQETDFDPGVQPGNTSSVMWIQTNAPKYTIGRLNFIDGDVAEIDAYAPNSVVPEPMSLSLLGTGLFGLIGLRRKKS